MASRHHQSVSHVWLAAGKLAAAASLHRRDIPSGDAHHGGNRGYVTRAKQAAADIFAWHHKRMRGMARGNMALSIFAIGARVRWQRRRHQRAKAAARRAASAASGGEASAINKRNNAMK